MRARRASERVLEQRVKGRIEAAIQKVSKMRGKPEPGSADGAIDVVALAPIRRNILDHESKELLLMAMKKATRKKARRGRRKGGRKKATKKGRKGGRRKGRRKKKA
jgi:hypothetical protein